MHNQLKKLLPTAKGESQHVIIIVADIRGFSKFSRFNDSADVATYISKIYLKLIEDFTELSKDIFYKTTGDGMLMAVQYNELNLEDMYNNVIKKCLKCGENFSTLLKKINMINFETPQRIGFGISRGTACALKSTSESNELLTLDYSGHKLNIASRFQDLARPSGVVIEGPQDIEMLKPELKKLFKEHIVYIKSVAESDPISVWVSKNVKISQSNLMPFTAIWDNFSKSFSRTDFFKETLNANYTLKLGRIVTDSMTVYLIRPSILPIEGKGRHRIRLEKETEFSIHYEGEVPKVLVKFPIINETNKNFLSKVRPRDRITLKFQYQVIMNK